MNPSFEQVNWLKSAVVYEVNIRQYTKEGNFCAFQKHLPRLKDMGVDVIWLMPITPISEVGKKGSLGSYYACSSYQKINPAFGNEKDFASLVEATHALGMKIIIDWVANHTGRQHEWMQAHPDWFTRDAAGEFTERNGWEDVVDLNFSNTAMRSALIASMDYWVRQYDIDGFRCDMAHLVPLDFWVTARTQLQKVKKLYWLAETEDLAYHSVFDTSYAWEWMHRTAKMNEGEGTLHEVYTVLHEYAQYPAGATKLFFTSNHDENTWNGTEYEKYGVAAKAWAVFSFTWKGIPLIYSGQELPNYKRLAFFDKDIIEWDNTLPRLHAFYKTLAHARKNYAALTLGATFNLPSDGGVMAFIRHDTSGLALVVLNVSKQVQKLHVNHSLLIGNFKNIFSGLVFTFAKEVDFELLPGDYFVYVNA